MEATWVQTLYYKVGWTAEEQTFWNPTYLELREQFRTSDKDTDLCFGSVTFWYGSGSSNPYLSLTDPDPPEPDADSYQNLQ